MKPLVTVAIPTLNGTDYLAEALTSALAQDYPNLEILVSDNGSRNETQAVAAALINGDQRVRFRRNDSPVPIHEHFTQCLQVAQGEFFILLCDDDRISPSCVSELVAVAMRHPEVNVVVPANTTIDERGTLIERCDTPDAEVFDGPELVCRWLYGRAPRMFVNVVTVLGRSAVLRRFGGYQGLAGGRNNDNLLFLQCAMTGRVGFARRAVFNWRAYSSSYGSNVTAEQIAESSRQFLLHLQRDPCTVQALSALPPGRRRQIRDGVRFMTARELLFHIKFHEGPFRWESLRAVFLYRRDGVFWLLVLRQCYRSLRQFFRPFRDWISARG